MRDKTIWAAILVVVALAAAGCATYEGVRRGTTPGGGGGDAVTPGEPVTEPAPEPTTPEPEDPVGEEEGEDDEPPPPR